MIRIAIVDDDRNSIKNCRNIITSMHLVDVWIDTYENSTLFDELLFTKHENFDVIILDIDMPDINGFDIAEKIYDLELGIVVIFYTAHEQYVFKAYDYQPFRYIRKEFAEKELPYAINSALTLIEKRKSKLLTLRSEYDNIIVECSKIIYFETNNKRIDLYLNDNRIINVRKSVKELFELVDNEIFFQIYNGVVVNLKYVVEYNSKEITLKSGKKLLISRRKYSSFKEKMTAYSRYRK